MIEWLVKFTLKVLLIFFVIPSVVVLVFKYCNLVMGGDVTTSSFFQYLPQHSYAVVWDFYAYWADVLRGLPHKLVN